MPPLLLAAGLVWSPAADPGPPPAGWTFVDEASRDGRSVVTYRTAELADRPTRPLHPDDRPPAGAKFGSVGLGPAGRHRLGLVWQPTTGTLWFDADGDGRFAAGERVTLGDKPYAAKVAVPFGGGASQERTVLIRKRGDGLAWAVRGYTTGAVEFSGRRVAALLTDGDADGCFDGAGADRVWLDLDGDGRFDPLTEQFPLGSAIDAGGTAVLVRPRPDGLGATARERPSESGTLSVEVARLAKTEVVELAANYVSEFGELVVVRAEGKPAKMPAGKYRVDSVRLKLLDPDGKVWHYTFASADRSTYGVEVARGTETTHRLLGGVKVTVAFDAGGVAPGGAVQVQPGVEAGGLDLTSCEVAERFTGYGRGVQAGIALTEPGSVPVDQCESGFH
ncbi:MAG: hypothetical protein JWO38_3406 [Gemmataceae bacterium]|nr:hypothetical protein [Gemmataceae bacterium]